MESSPPAQRGAPRGGRPVLAAFVLLLGLLASVAASAHGKKEARGAWTSRPPRIDGRLDDRAWREAPVHGGFTERTPRLGAQPPEATSFIVLYDARALYVGVRCHDSRPDAVRARTRTRDSFQIFNDDAISIKIDAAHDHRTTHGFALNPAGARLDYRGINESEFRVEFDAIWQGAAQRDPGGWTAEFRIPWAALGIDPADPPTTLGLDLSRDHSRRAATYDWVTLVPPHGPIAAHLYGHLVGLEALRARVAGVASNAHRTREFTIVPYVIGGFRQQPNAAAALQVEPEVNGGADARMALGGGWRGQLTVNTDFAQVDLDDQVVNLTRFGLFLPEKRDFFLRELEWFAYGRPQEAQLLHTRRIGLRPSGETVPIFGGLKLVGRPTDRVRVGVVQVTTRPAGDEPWTSHAVARGQLEGADGSNLGMMVTHRQSLEGAADHNLVVGLDGAWRGGGSPMLVQAFALASMTGSGAGEAAPSAGANATPDDPDRPTPAAGLELGWRGLLWRPRASYAYYHPDLRADLGFLRRVGVHEMTGSLAVEPRFDSYGLEHLNVELFGGAVASAESPDLLDFNAGASATLKWDAGFAVFVAGERLSETVLAPFTVGRQTEIAPGQYGMNKLTLDLDTPPVLPVSLSATAIVRDFYQGRLWSLEATITVRASALVTYEVTGLHGVGSFDDRARDFHTTVLFGRLGLSFTPSLNLDGYFAWNDLADLLRFQARLRWTYTRRSGSDIFVVYQHDVDDDGGFTTFQSLLLKATYSWH